MTDALAQPQSKAELQRWAPNLFGRQWQVFNSQKRVTLVTGSRYSGKSISVMHTIVRWAVQTPGSRTAIFAKSLSLAKDGGVWQDLIDIVLPSWFEGPHGIHFTTKDKNKVPGPTQDGQTRVPLFRISDMCGGESEFKLFSINNDDEVASKVKGKRFSTIYFAELSMFKDRKILGMTLPQLRMEHLQPRPGEPDPYHHWIADTNPDEDLGTDSWIYKIWYQERHDANHPYPEFRDQLNVIEMPVEENPYITPYQIQELEAMCAGDDMLMDAYRRGIWPTRGGRKYHFRGIYLPSKHVVGNHEEGDQIEVHETSTTLFSGWDTGTVNHAVVLLDKCMFFCGDKERAYWSVLDEYVCLQEQTELSEVVDSVMNKMRVIELRHGHRFGWVHWSDNSALTMWNPTHGSFDSTEITACSGGTIHLQGVVKSKGSVGTRIRLLRRLLKEGRIFISARCVRVQEMLDKIKQSPKENQEIQPHDKLKHVFDALTYPIMMESLGDMEDGLLNSEPGPKLAQMISL